MSIRIRYMGNKAALAPAVAALVADLPAKGQFVDLFCGMCSVGGAVSDGRPVWGNDVQRAATLVARCLLTEPVGPPGREVLEAILTPRFERNRDRLLERFADDVANEAAFLADADVEACREATNGWAHAGNDSSRGDEVRAMASEPRKVPYRLATLTFSHGYFGLSQSIEIDSYRYAIDRAVASGDLSSGQARWALIALIQAASVIASTPGHFAQYLKPASDTGVQRILRQRLRSVWDVALNETDRLAPLGGSDWRSSNKVFNQNALKIWPTLRDAGFNDGIVYADPPYSVDHYSRYYHVLDTLVRYDYPTASGAGRYRPDRFATPFSLATRVEWAFDRLCWGVARLGGTLVLSYPSNGLLLRRHPDGLARVLDKHFSSVRLALRQATEHSTLGARHGRVSNTVDELVYVAAV